MPEDFDRAEHGLTKLCIKERNGVIFASFANANDLPALEEYLGESNLYLNDDGVLVLPSKNMTPFSGAATELVGFCGKRVVVDGLFSTNRGYKIFALQFVREAPEGKWQRANRFLNKWAAENGVDVGSPEAKQWFRNDPVVKQLIGEEGTLGLGLEVDEKYLSSQ